jgi:putative endonuclease
VSGDNLPATANWWVYILRCADATLYVGIARDLQARLREHNGDAPGGARYTRGRRPVALLAACPCADRREAARLEWRVKQLPRAAKAALIGAEGWRTADELLAFVGDRENQAGR